MKDLIKDLQGAIQVDEVLPESPNRGKLEKGDILIKAGGERITSLFEGFHAARRNIGKTLRVEFFRNGMNKQTDLSFLDVSEQVKTAQDEIIKSG